jgi:hypothetical protein
MMATLKPATQVHNYDDSTDNVMSCREREREKEKERENEMMQKSLIIKCIIIL